jgi:hypothetical protein
MVKTKIDALLVAASERETMAKGLLAAHALEWD